MNCDAVEPQLIGYHFGTLTGDVRAAVEMHLVECADCVKAFVALKRAVESPEEEEPSPSARARIRRSVELELHSSKVVPLRRRTRERRLALGIASAAVVVTATFVHRFWTHPGHAPHGFERAATLEQRAR